MPRAQVPIIHPSISHPYKNWTVFSLIEIAGATQKATSAIHVSACDC